jgi:hypothetical protein
VGVTVLTDCARSHSSVVSRPIFHRELHLGPQHQRLEASGYDIPASEIKAGMELHLPCLVKVGQGNNGYKTIEEFLPEAAE